VANWMGVVSAEHVRQGVRLGIAQIAHGKRGPLARLMQGDGFVYYSPRESLRDARSTLQAFTAIGVVPDNELWQADEGDFLPWRRRLDYDTTARVAPLAELRDQLELTASPSWGMVLRRGLVPLSDHDFALIPAAMTTP
jgi:hypothetical protein